MKTPILFNIAKDIRASESISDEVINAVRSVATVKDPVTTEDVVSLVVNIVTPFKFEAALNFRDVVNSVSAAFVKAKHHYDFSTEDFV